MDPVLVIGESVLSADPGGQARARVTVRNVGEIVAQYRFEVLGEAARWATVVPAHVSVLPGESQEQTVEVLFRPPVAPAAPVGTIPFGVRCVSMERQDVAAVVEGDIVVSAVQDLDARLRPDGSRGARAGHYRVDLHNTGTADLEVELAVADRAELLRFALAPTAVEVPAGATVPSYLAVQPRTPKLVGKPLPHPFTVTYRVPGTDRAGELAETYVQRPTVRRWMVVLTILLVGALVAAYLILRGQGGSTALEVGLPPTVAVTSATGGPGVVEIHWQRSPYATGYSLQELSEAGDATGALKIDAAQTSTSWPDRSAGTHCYRVAVEVEDKPGGYGEQKCTEVLPGAGTETPAPTPSATAGGAPFEPVGFYAIFGNFPLSDAANQGAAMAMLAALQGAGAEGVQMRSSLDSATFADGAGNAGNTVVFKDGFASEAEARAVCDQFRAIAGSCVVQGSAPPAATP